MAKDKKPEVAETEEEKTQVPEGMQLVSTADLKALIEAGKNAERLSKQLLAEREETRNVNGNPRVMNKITEKVASVRVVDGKIVTGYVNHSKLKDGRRFVYQIPDPTNPKEKIDMIDLVLMGEDEPKTMQYLDFINGSDKIQCKIKSIQAQEKSNEDTAEYVKKAVYGDWSRTVTDIDVPLLDEWVERTYTLENPETKEPFEVRDLFINP